MSIASFYVRNMLHQDDRQLVTARRMARYRHALRTSPAEEPAFPEDMKRSIMVNRVARELFENLLFTGSDTPMVQEVHDELIQEFGDSLVFQYPPGSLEMVILRKTPKGMEEVSPPFRVDVLERAWALTLAKVDETML
ncbi:MAG: DVU0524 family FlgM-associated protein [Bilophila sp.]